MSTTEKNPWIKYNKINPLNLTIEFWLKKDKRKTTLKKYSNPLNSQWERKPNHDWGNFLLYSKYNRLALINHTAEFIKNK